VKSHFIVVLFVALFQVRAAGEGTPAPGPVPANVAESLRDTFGDSVKIVPVNIVLTDSEKAVIGRISTSPFADDTLRVFTCGSADTVAGYGILDNVMGKSRFITFLLSVGPDGAVAGVDILVYRESHGGEISNSAFRRQFIGRKAGDPMTPGRDIRTISGATISSRAVTAGVSKLLAAFALTRGRIR